MTQKQNEPQAPTRYIPVAIFDEYHPWPTPQSLRNRKHAAERGNDPDFLKCIKKVGGRILIDEQAFLRWVEAQAESAAAG